MRFETWMLRGLFVTCLAVCALILGAMLNATTPPAEQLAAASRVGTLLLAAPTSCALPQDGVICPPQG